MLSQTTTTPVLPRDVTDANHVYLSSTSHCGDDEGAIGIFSQYSSDYILLCLKPPTELAFVTPEPTELCNESDKMHCLEAKDCGVDSIIRGFTVNAASELCGPCSDGFNSWTSQAVLDNKDCHTVAGPMQPRPSGQTSSWQQWRICGGDDKYFYVMTAMHITKTSDDSWNYDSITCCRIRPVA